MPFRLTYSALVVEIARAVCFFENHDVRQHPTNVQIPLQFGFFRTHFTISNVMSCVSRKVPLQACMHKIEEDSDVLEYPQELFLVVDKLNKHPPSLTVGQSSHFVADCARQHRGFEGNEMSRSLNDLIRFLGMAVQTSAVTTVMTAILKQFQATPPPASVKAVEEICVTCGGPHPYYQCLAADGNTFLEYQDNIQGYVAAAAGNYNQGNAGYRPPGCNFVHKGRFPRKLTEALILIAPDWDLPFELLCDASDFAIGAVLGQRKNKHFQPIHYASKTMTEAQAHYTTTETLGYIPMSTAINGGQTCRKPFNLAGSPMISEETPKKSKEQTLQEEASLAEAIRLDSLQKEEEAKQIHLDSLLAQRIAEEEE
ncbi:reverse transcriptase domain-containing protein [Tanacetum coccineum]